MTAEELWKKDADQYTFLLIRETASASERPEKLFSRKSHAGVIYLTYTICAVSITFLLKNLLPLILPFYILYAYHNSK